MIIATASRSSALTRVKGPGLPRMWAGVWAMQLSGDLEAEGIKTGAPAYGQQPSGHHALPRISHG